MIKNKKVLGKVLKDCINENNIIIIAFKWGILNKSALKKQKTKNKKHICKLGSLNISQKEQKLERKWRENSAQNPR